ncbi:unnamed protein product, partial [Larinioides sclopetarius]
RTRLWERYVSYKYYTLTSLRKNIHFTFDLDIELHICSPCSHTLFGYPSKKSKMNSAHFFALLVVSCILSAD